MSTLVTINGSNLPTNSRADINGNFAALNSEKLETSVLDTDTTLAANSDSKVPTQKAVKAYVDAGGNVNASETTKGIVEIATQAEVDAGTNTGATGAKLVVTPETLKAITTPIVRVYTCGTSVGSSTTRFDITNPSGTTFRYTYDGTGTDPVINTTTFPTGAIVAISNSTTFNKVNRGIFTITGSGTNYFEVTNPTGVEQSDATINTNGYIKVSIPQTWTKPQGLRYVVVEAVGGGGGAYGLNTASAPGIGGSGSGAGYCKKTIGAASLGTTEIVTVGVGGTPGEDSNPPVTGFDGTNSTFGSHVTAGKGLKGVGVGTTVAGGTATGGDINIPGTGPWQYTPTGSNPVMLAGQSFIGKPTDPYTSAPSSGYGFGGTGGYEGVTNTTIIGSGGDGVVIVTEYYV